VRPWRIWPFALVVGWSQREVGPAKAAELLELAACRRRARRIASRAGRRQERWRWTAARTSGRFPPASRLARSAAREHRRPDRRARAPSLNGHTSNSIAGRVQDTVIGGDGRLARGAERNGSGRGEARCHGLASRRGLVDVVSF
jgi:hypothetical protein